MDVINRLIAASCWQNIHAVPQHGAVFGMERRYIYAIVVILVTSCILALMDNVLGNRKTCTDE